MNITSKMCHTGGRSMLVKITSNEAFEMLMDNGNCNKVYFKHNTDYFLARDYKWEFTHKDVIPAPSTNFVTAKFYKEVED